MTELDIELLQSRVTDELPTEAVYVYGKRKPVKARNEEKLRGLPGKPRVFKAVLGRKTRKKPKVNKAGFINETPFVDCLEVKIGARVMLTYNCNTGDGLTNGATGVVKGFLTNKGERAAKDADASYILVEFDAEKIGRAERQKSKHLMRKCPHKNATPIPKVKFAYSMGRSSKNHTSKDYLIQFPLTLAWAMTAHKCQGQTIKAPTPLVADIDSVFSAGQAYVILGRIQNIDQLFLQSFSLRKIIVDENALREASRIRASALNIVPNRWTEQNTFVRKISSLNIRSLGRHLQDLSVDSTLLQSDYICLQETWLTKDKPLPTLDGYKVYLSGEGRGKGVATYVKTCLTKGIHSISHFSNELFQLLKISLKEFDLVNIYRSPSAESNKNISHFSKTVSKHITVGRNTVICGDMNIDLSIHKGNDFSRKMSELGFSQLITKPTHLCGGILDHCYVRSPYEVYWDIYSPYYTDHDALNIVVKKNLC